MEIKRDWFKGNGNEESVQIDFSQLDLNAPEAKDVYLGEGTMVIDSNGIYRVIQQSVQPVEPSVQSGDLTSWRLGDFDFPAFVPFPPKPEDEIKAEQNFWKAETNVEDYLKSTEEFFSYISDSDYVSITNDELTAQMILDLGKFADLMNSPLKQLKIELKAFSFMLDYFVSKPNEFKLIDGEIYAYAQYAESLARKLLFTYPFEDFVVEKSGFTGDPKPYFDRMQELEDEISIIEQMEK